MLMLLLNLIYAGHLDLPNALPAVGLSQTFNYMVMVSFLLGITASLDTLITQEFGARNYESCAVYFNKMILATNLVMVLFSPLFFYAGYLFELVGVESDLAELS